MPRRQERGTRTNFVTKRLPHYTIFHFHSSSLVTSKVVGCLIAIVMTHSVLYYFCHKNFHFQFIIALFIFVMTPFCWDMILSMHIEPCKIGGVIAIEDFVGLCPNSTSSGGLGERWWRRDSGVSYFEVSLYTNYFFSQRFTSTSSLSSAQQWSTGPL